MDEIKAKIDKEVATASNKPREILQELLRRAMIFASLAGPYCKRISEVFDIL